MTTQQVVYRRMGWKKLILPVLIFFLFQKACSPPIIDQRSGAAIPVITVDEFYDAPRSFIGIPVEIEGEVRASAYLAPLGGFFFLESLESEQTIICLMKGMPPREHSVIRVLGVVQPFLVQGEVNLTYLKYKSSKGVDGPVNA